VAEKVDAGLRDFSNWGGGEKWEGESGQQQEEGETTLRDRATGNNLRHAQGKQDETSEGEGGQEGLNEAAAPRGRGSAGRC